MLPDPPVYVTEDDKNWVLCGMRITLYSNEPDNMVASWTVEAGGCMETGNCRCFMGRQVKRHMQA